MLKHRGFPSRLPGTDFHFTIRRANVKEGATKIIRRERFKDRKHVDRLADQAFMAALWQHFGEEPFDLIDPGRVRRCEVHVEAGMLLDPRGHGRGLVCAVVVADHVHV